MTKPKGTRWMVVALMLAACGGSDEDKLTPGVDFTCSPQDRTGTYVVRFFEVSGNCGPQTDVVGRLDGSDALEPGCELTAPDVWEDGDCTLTRQMRCVDTVEFYTVEFVVVTTQQDPDGEVLEGTGTIDVTGSTACFGRYDMRAERQ